MERTDDGAITAHGWAPVSPKALLAIGGLLYRCPVCHCLVLDVGACMKSITLPPDLASRPVERSGGMAVQTCPRCSAAITDEHQRFCPECGRYLLDDPLPTTARRAPHIGSWRLTRNWQITLAVVAVIVMWSIFAGWSKTDKNAEAWDACHHLVSARLKAPAGAEYEPIAEARIHHDGTHWSVAGHVDAQNSFGANVRSSYVCDMTNVQGNEYHANKVDVLP